jgi:hypothetical protein
MANEIKITTSLSVGNGALNVPAVSSSKAYDQAAPIAPAPGGVEIGIAEETINFGDVTPGWTMITNLDDTNFVEFGFSTGVYGFVLPAGASCVMKLNGVTLYAKADTAACQIYVQGVND